MFHRYQIKVNGNISERDFVDLRSAVAWAENEGAETMIKVNIKSQPIENKIYHVKTGKTTRKHI